MASTDTQKICTLCGEDCSQHARIKDPSGHYYCKTCHQAALERKASMETPLAPPPAVMDGEPFDVMAQIALDAEASASSVAACSSCFRPLPAGATLCTNCGFDLRTGRPADSSVRPSIRPTPAGTKIEPPSMEPTKLTIISAAVRPAEYIKAGVLMLLSMLVATFALTEITVESGGAAVVAAAATAVDPMFYPIVLIATAIVGAGVFWLLARVWLGDIGPVPLIMLRVGAIFAAVDAVLALSVLIGLAGAGTVGVVFAFLLGAACCFAMTAWVFELGVGPIFVLLLLCAGIHQGVAFLVTDLSAG